MYIVKNAWKNIIRSKGRNILIGIIIAIVTISSYNFLAINNSSNNLEKNYKINNPLEVTLGIDIHSLMESHNNDNSTQIESLTVDEINNYGNSDYVKDYYYYYSTSLSSDITAISMDDFFKNDNDETHDNPKMQPNDKEFKNDEDFKFSAYSNISYIESFINGTNKISEGEIFDNDNTNDVIIISSDLANENNLQVGDKITFYSSNDATKTIELEILGIYEDSSDNSENFMGMNAMMSSNQIYTTISAMEKILELKDVTNNTLNAKFYLNNSDDLESFSNELREKGLSNYYSINDNSNSILEILKPIQNISSFSITFLIVICVVATLVIGVLTMINIRDRKYEIGVLRAIGMSKLKVMMQLLIEILIVTLIAIILGIGIGKISSQPVTNVMLEQEISKYQEEQNQIQDNFGGKEINRGGFDNRKPGENNNINYVDSLTVSIKPIAVLEVAGISILITLLCGTISIMYVNRYSPNKILQNRG